MTAIDLTPPPAGTARRPAPRWLTLFLVANAAFGVIVVLTGTLPHITLHAGSPWWVIALGLPVAAVLTWALTVVRRGATTGRRGRLYPLALVLTVLLLVASCLLLVVVVAMALQGGAHL